MVSLPNNAKHSRSSHKSTTSALVYLANGIPCSRVGDLHVPREIAVGQESRWFCSRFVLLTESPNLLLNGDGGLGIVTSAPMSWVKLTIIIFSPQ